MHLTRRVMMKMTLYVRRETPKKIEMDCMKDDICKKGACKKHLAGKNGRGWHIAPTPNIVNRAGI